MSEVPSVLPRDLPVLLGPLKGAAEMLILVGARDSAGVVHLRTWSADDWSAPPRVYAERANTLLEWIESQAARGRTMNQSLYAVRLWLRGEGKAVGE